MTDPSSPPFPRPERRPSGKMSAYVLWLVRTRQITSVADFNTLFGITPQLVFSAQAEILRIFNTLLDVGFMRRTTGGGLEVTPLTERLRDVLGVSLTELAHFDMESSLRVVPLFRLRQIEPSARVPTCSC
jgi:hypothetical protein